eukprot:1155740-Pelagomonas_calceolata.AAC.4
MEQQLPSVRGIAVHAQAVSVRVHGIAVWVCAPVSVRAVSVRASLVRAAESVRVHGFAVRVRAPVSVRAVSVHANLVRAAVSVRVRAVRVRAVRVCAWLPVCASPSGNSQALGPA